MGQALALSMEGRDGLTVAACFDRPDLSDARLVTQAQALDLCDVASGRFDGPRGPLLAPWDLAAGILRIRARSRRSRDRSPRQRRATPRGADRREQQSHARLAVVPTGHLISHAVPSAHRVIGPSMPGRF